MLAAYRQPDVTPVTTRFTFSPPNPDGLFAVATGALGWTPARAEAEIGPLIRELASGRTQSSLDSFLVPKLRYEDADHAAKIKSTRLATAVRGLAERRGGARWWRRRDRGD